MSAKKLRLLFGIVQILIMTGVQGFSQGPTYQPVAGFIYPPTNPQAGMVSDGAGNYWGTTSAGGAFSQGTVYKVSGSTGAITTVAAFTGSTSGTDNARGAQPQATLVSDGTGNFWGTTTVGGALGKGTVFRVTMSTGAMTTVADFTGTTSLTNNARGSNPQARLFNDGAGNLWGTTFAGGSSNKGTVFKVNVTTGAMTTVVDFTGTTSLTDNARGSSPDGGLVSDTAGNLWGTTEYGGLHGCGTVFELNTTSGTITKVVDFPTRYWKPAGDLVSDGAGNFWGTTLGGAFGGNGTVFKMNTTTGVFTTVVAFTASTSGSARGSQPAPGLVSDGAGNFWGTTSFGGANGQPIGSAPTQTSGAGTLFMVNATSGALTTVADFTDSRTGSARGGRPAASLMCDDSGNLWGTTLFGGLSTIPYEDGYGTVFTVNAATGAITTVADFGINPAGFMPNGGLAKDGAGNLWGTAQFGGTNANGTVFKLVTSTGSMAAVVAFCGTDDPQGSNPEAGLVSDGNGNFWGTTCFGGSQDGGTIFEVSGTAGIITVGSFMQASYPQSTLLKDGTGNFWGTTSFGNLNWLGTVFKVNPTTGVVQNVVNFDNSTKSTDQSRGCAPAAGLVSDGAGYFWGTTNSGGLLGWGTIFKVKAATGAITTVVDFTGPSLATTGTDNRRGANPNCALAVDVAGNLWGTTNYGGSDYDVGTIFKLNPKTGVITTVAAFDGSTDPTDNVRGSRPQGAMVSDGAGNLWGTTTSGGTYGYGTVFEVNSYTGAVTTVFDFTGRSGSVPGANPMGSLLVTGSGLYGVTQSGGVTSSGNPAGGGQIFFIGGIFVPPPYTVNPATVSVTGVTLSASVNPNGVNGPTGSGLNVMVSWQYGLTSGNYTATTYPIPIGTDTSPVPVSTYIPAAALTKSIYHYRLAISSGQGIEYGPDQEFSFKVPTMTPGSPVAVTNGATLSGTVNPNLLDTQVYFRYGLTGTYGGMTASQDIGSGSTGATTSAALTGLSPNLLYHYQIVTVNVTGTYYGIDQTFTALPMYGTTVLLDNKTAVPGIPNGSFKTFGIPVENDLDHIAFQATVTGSGVFSTGGTANNSGIWAQSGTNGLGLIARTGSNAPGYDGITPVGTFAVLSDPVYSGSDAVAFLGTLVTGSTITATNKTGIWATTSGTLALVARAGDFAPDMNGNSGPGSPVFSTFSQFVLPEQGGVVMAATLVSGTGGVVSANNQGIWAVDTSGVLKQVIRKGDALTFNGKAKTLAGLTIFNAPAASTGQTRHFNYPGDLLYTATFSDGTTGIVQTVFP